MPSRTHGHTSGHHTDTNRATPEYRVWVHIKNRCHNPNDAAYGYYGGRGIFVAQAWRNNFAAFLEHVGLKPSPLHTIDRIDNDRGYEPGNVRWATRKEQQRNMRTNVLITIRGESRTLGEWAEQPGAARFYTIRKRLRAGWPPERAVFAMPLRLPSGCKSAITDLVAWSDGRAKLSSSDVKEPASSTT